MTQSRDFLGCAANASEAPEAVGAQRRFWEMHDLLFENQDALSDENLAQYASAAGIDARRVINEILTGFHTERMREDFRCGARATTVKSKPTGYPFMGMSLMTSVYAGKPTSHPHQYAHID